MKNNKEAGERPIILKSGATDLRRQERTLTELAERNYPDGVKPGVLYAFSNKNNTAIKIVKVDADAGVSLLKLKRKEPYPWPEYHKKGEEGYTVALTGKKKKRFLRTIGCPEDL
jgi:hypothetical protein